MESALHRRSGAAADRHQEVLQRSRELHARQPVHPRRGTRGCGTSSWRRASTRSASPPPAGPDAPWREWIVGGEPQSDLVGVDIRRFAPFNGNNQWLHDRVGEVLGLHYAVPWPNREFQTARPVPPLAGPPPRRGGRRLLRLEDGLGAAQLLRARRAATRHRVLVGQAELDPLGRRRAAGHPRGRRPVRRDLVRQAARPGRATRRTCCSGCAPPTSPCPSAARSTRACSTRAAPTRPT